MTDVVASSLTRKAKVTMSDHHWIAVSDHINAVAKPITRQATTRRRRHNVN
jgi:hypothetical protein